MLLSRQAAAPRAPSGPVSGSQHTLIQHGRQRCCLATSSHHPRRMPLASYDSDEQGESGDYDLIISQPPEGCPLFFMLSDLSMPPADSSSDAVLWHCSALSQPPAGGRHAVAGTMGPSVAVCSSSEAWTSVCEMHDAQEAEQQLIACCTTVANPPSAHQALMALTHMHQSRHEFSPAALRADVPATLLSAVLLGAQSSAFSAEQCVHAMRSLLVCVPSAQLDVLAHRFDLSVLYDQWDLCSASQLVGLLSDLASAATAASSTSFKHSRASPSSHSFSSSAGSSMHSHSSSGSSASLSSAPPVPAHASSRLRHTQLAAHVLRLPLWHQKAAHLSAPLALSSISALTQLLRPLRAGSDAPFAEVLMRRWLQLVVPSLSEQLDRSSLPLVSGSSNSSGSGSSSSMVRPDQHWHGSRVTSFTASGYSYTSTGVNFNTNASNIIISSSPAEAGLPFDSCLMQDPAQLVSALCTVQEALVHWASPSDRSLTLELTRTSQQLSSRLASLPLPPDALPLLPALLLQLSTHPSLPKPRAWVPALSAAVASRAPAVASLSWRQALQLTVDSGLLLERASGDAQRATRGAGVTVLAHPSPSSRLSSISSGLRAGGSAGRARAAAAEAAAAAAAANATADAVVDAQKLRQQLLGHLRRRLLDAGLPGLWALSHAWSTPTSSVSSSSSVVVSRRSSVPFDEELMACVVGAAEELAMLDVGCVQAPMVGPRAAQRRAQPELAMQMAGGGATSTTAAAFSSSTTVTSDRSISSGWGAPALPSLSLHHNSGSGGGGGGGGHNTDSGHSFSVGSITGGSTASIASMDGVSANELLGLVYEGSMEGFGVAVRRLEEVCLHAGMAVEARLALFGRMRRTLMLRSTWGIAGEREREQDASGDAWW